MPAQDPATASNASIDAWRINARVTSFLVEHLTPELWRAALPSSPRRPVRSIAVHLHNTRCLWMKSLAGGIDIAIPPRLAPARATPAQLLDALPRSAEAIERMLHAGIGNGGAFPGVTSAFVYGAMPRDVTLFVGYALSHEAHHRGQIVMMARELGHRLPSDVIAGLWQWSSRLRDTRTA